MTDYVKSTNFTSKDALASGNPLKIVKGTEFDIEFNNIAVAVATKADIINPALSGVPTAPTATAGNNTTQIATTAFANTAASAATTTERTTTATITNKTINLANNTVTGTKAEFNTACSDADFASLAGTETLTNKTTNLTSNTLTGTKAQFNTACSDTDFSFLNDFTGSNQSKAASGYQKLPGGLILQWGSQVNNVNAGVVTFPTAFPTACASVQATFSSSDTSVYAPVLQNISASGFTQAAYTSYDFISFYWFAVGY